MKKVYVLFALCILSVIMLVAVMTRDDSATKESTDSDQEVKIETNQEGQSMEIRPESLLEESPALSEAEGNPFYDLSFKHTVPGEYSEIFVTAVGYEPGEKVIAYLKKTGADEYEPTGHEVFADGNGVVNTSFRITSYGSYDVEVYYGTGGTRTDTIVVE